jgi:hypothetical protein
MTTAGTPGVGRAGRYGQSGRNRTRVDYLGASVVLGASSLGASLAGGTAAGGVASGAAVPAAGAAGSPAGAGLGVTGALGAGVPAAGAPVFSSDVQPTRAAPKIRLERVLPILRLNFTDELLHWKVTRGAMVVHRWRDPEVNAFRARASTRTTRETHPLTASHSIAIIALPLSGRNEKGGNV